MRTAILVDGAFFLKRYRKLYNGPYDAKTIADKFYTMALSHVEGKSLYRILYYDCIPFKKKINSQISSKLIDFSITEEAQFRYGFFNELKKKRKIALRLGEIHDGRKWIIKSETMAELRTVRLKFESQG